MKPMTRKDAIHNLRKVLVRRRDALRNALSGDWSMLQELRAQSKGDVVDFAVDAVQDEISSQLAEVESRELANIEKALERIRDGEYGVCDHCSGAIPLARLQALPYATSCIRCQRELEKIGAGGGPPDWGRLVDAPSFDHEVMYSDIELDAS
jgi:DnaK suppressor protein